MEQEPDIEAKFIAALDSVRPNWWKECADRHQLAKLLPSSGVIMEGSIEALKKSIVRDIGQTFLHAAFVAGIVGALANETGDSLIAEEFKEAMAGAASAIAG